MHAPRSCCSASPCLHPRRCSWMCPTTRISRASTACPRAVPRHGPTTRRSPAGITRARARASRSLPTTARATAATSTATAAEPRPSARSGRSARAMPRLAICSGARGCTTTRARRSRRSMCPTWASNGATARPPRRRFLSRTCSARRRSQARSSISRLRAPPCLRWTSPVPSRAAPQVRSTATSPPTASRAVSRSMACRYRWVRRSCCDGPTPITPAATMASRSTSSRSRRTAARRCPH